MRFLFQGELSQLSLLRAGGRGVRSASSPLPSLCHMHLGVPSAAFQGSGLDGKGTCATLAHRVLVNSWKWVSPELISIWFAPPSQVHCGLHFPASLAVSGDHIWFWLKLLWWMQEMSLLRQSTGRANVRSPCSVFFT